MKNITDFLLAALPWICVGLFLAIVIVRGSKKKDDEKDTMNYGTEGMSLGMCFGTAIGTSLGNNTGIGMIIGLLVGLVIGSSIEKVDGKEYITRQWINAGMPIPSVGSHVKLVYEADKPSKARMW